MLKSLLWVTFNLVEYTLLTNIDDEIKRKKDAYNAKRREQRIKKKLILKKEAEQRVYPFLVQQS